MALPNNAYVGSCQKCGMKMTNEKSMPQFCNQGYCSFWEEFGMTIAEYRAHRRAEYNEVKDEVRRIRQKVA